LPELVDIHSAVHSYDVAAGELWSLQVQLEVDAGACVVNREILGKASGFTMGVLVVQGTSSTYVA